MLGQYETLILTQKFVGILIRGDYICVGLNKVIKV